MNHRLKAYTISLLIHSSMLALLLTFRPNVPVVKEIELDLSTYIPENPQKTNAERLKEVIKRHTPNIHRPLLENKPPHEEKVTTVKTAEKEADQKPHDVQPITYPVSQKQDVQHGQKQESTSEGDKKSNKSIELSSKDTKSSDQRTEKSTEEERFLKEHLQIIREILQKNTNYPPIARKMGWEGTVILSFRLCEDGKVEDIKVEKSSGFEVLDRSALEAVKRCSHMFPKPHAAVRVKVPIRFLLE